MQQRLKQTEEESWYESSETNSLKPDWFSQHQPTFLFTFKTRQDKTRQENTTQEDELEL